jgi:hypothetical protein
MLGASPHHPSACGLLEFVAHHLDTQHPGSHRRHALELQTPEESDLISRVELPVLTASHRGYRSIREWCRSQDILAVIGRYVALDSRGVGSCPFKEHHYRGDLRPSFQVFGRDDPHWYCYTWRCAGDLFDFLCLYYQLTPQEAWQRVQDGGLW